MSFGIRRRLFLWLALVIVPVGAAIWVALELVEHRLVERIETDLGSVRSLEAARLTEGLESYRREATSLASDPGVGDLISEAIPVAQVDRSGRGTPSAAVNPAARRELDVVADSLLRRAQSAGGQVIAVRIVARGGQVLADSGGFAWEPEDPALIDRALASGRPVFGDAFRIGSTPELGIVAPIFNSSAVIVGAVLLETRLGPIIEPLARHQGFGDTREAYLAQTASGGAGVFITPLRFDSEAAFRRAVAPGDSAPINQALESPNGMILNAPDYRGVESVLAVESLDTTGWGLVVKVDRSEAYALVGEVRQAVILSGLAALLISLVGWLTLVRPLGLRLRRSAHAAERVASGDYLTPIADDTRDEIGELSRTIDSLAADLDADIEKRTAAEGRLRHRASHDDLTGLYNRQHTSEVLKDLIESGSDEAVSLLFLDLDRFKLINDTHGHAVGDEVLAAVGGRLKGAVSKASTVARWGGDEFVVVLPACDDTQATAVVERLRRVFDRSVGTSSGPIDVYSSIGAATVGPGSTVDSLLQEADAGMFTDKELGARNRSASGVGLQAVSDALDDDRVEAWYQPIVSSSPEGELELFGIEALARIRQDNGQMLLPGDFLEAIADTQRAVELDMRIARQALRDLGRWRSEGRVDSELRLTLNLSGRSIGFDDFARALVAAADQAEVGLDSVVIELPEGVDDLDPAGLDALRATGATLGIDDFGADYSRLDRLISLSAQVVKLDRSWLADHRGGFDERERVVLGRLVDMCADLDMELVAEGVETPAQYRLLLGLGVPHFQGFHFAHPQPAEVLEGDWLSQRSSVTGGGGAAGRARA